MLRVPSCERIGKGLSRKKDPIVAFDKALKCVEDQYRVRLEVLVESRFQ